MEKKLDKLIIINLKGKRMEIVRVLRRGKKNSRVELVNGTNVLVSNEILAGGDFNPGDIQRKIDSAREFDLIQTELHKYINRTSTGIPSSMTEEDLAQDIFLSFWEKDYWGRYEAEKCPSWRAFIQVGIKNYMISLTNSAPLRETYRVTSLNRRIGDGSIELAEILADEKFSIEQVDEKMEIDAFRQYIEALGDSGISISFVDLYDRLLDGQKQSVIARESGYSETTIAARKAVLTNAYKTFNE